MTDSKLQELKAEAEERRYEVKLIQPHTHAGEELKPGDTLKVTAAQRAWLKDAGVIENPTADVSKEK
ncbi:hypothetical protein G7008_03370 [Pseudomonas psychrotolerans]|uniref:DUF7210 family protein n=1 Tax=Pseudomonas oryzihabitans TaxID=47885 RepID=UPI0015E3915F|nr:hypothetical protein [Pseudomonas psychrotolerans]MBA1179537.1 hypothetical protein [Pseudomonas psychrotolerans]MBA1214503.1 hypothetical protein [Pseudomonas psychrotolerans]